MPRRTKIVATLGPATRNPEILAGVIKVGADVLRLNFSHGTSESHIELIAIARAAARPAAGAHHGRSGRAAGRAAGRLDAAAERRHRERRDLPGRRIDPPARAR